MFDRLVLSVMRSCTAPCVLAWIVILFAPLWSASALTVTGYNAAANDRFVSGFPTNPVANTNGAFVGAGDDWSAVGWSSTSFGGGGFKGFGLLSPLHFLAAQHYEYTDEATLGVRVAGLDGVVSSAGVASLENLGQGIILANRGFTNHDLAVGLLSNLVTAPTNLARLAVLDLNASSTTTTLSAYNGLPVFAYGRGAAVNDSPRVGAATILQATNFFGDPTQASFLTTWNDVRLQVGDSGSPLLHSWVNPAGQAELTLLGLNSAVSEASERNIMSMMSTPAAMAAANAVMTVDGFALRAVGNPSNTWVGTASTAIGNRAAWGLSPPASAPSDRYVLFDGASAGGDRVVTINSAANLRGLYFSETGETGLGFTFSGDQVLTLGRGGLVNYDVARQNFTASLALGDHQYWDGGVGGITAGNMNNSGFLLEVTGRGTNRITGALSGTGGLAVSGGRLELTASNPLTGTAWVHAGELVVNGRLDEVAGVVVGEYGSLGGSGRVSAVTGSGSIDPGNSAGILTALSVDASSGLDFNFEFNLLGSPVFADAFASGNDLLRLTALAPFTASLSSVNTVNIYLGFASLLPGDVFRGGFFADEVSDFWASIEEAGFHYYLADPAGGIVYQGVSYREFDDYNIVADTVSQEADFADGTVTGGIVEFNVVPEPSTRALFFLGAGAAGWLVVRRRFKA